jgi:chromosome segregation ATPase
MNRSLLTLAAAMLLGSACDKSASEAQDSVNTAQANANTEITNARVAADEKAKAAQAEADKKIAQVQAEFAKASEDYRHTMQTNLDSIDKRLANLDAKLKTTTGAKGADLAATTAALHSQRDAFAIDVRSIDVASASTWDATKAHLDKAWSDLDGAVNKAY